MKTRLLTAGVIISTAGALLSGCATTRSKPADLDAQGMRNQVTALQAEVQARDQEIANLRNTLSGQGQQAPAAETASAISSKLTAKQIQAALKNAGYNPGDIDGKMGKQTRDAIRAFQKANGLKADGRVGKQTRDLLQKYLTAKIK